MSHYLEEQCIASIVAYFFIYTIFITGVDVLKEEQVRTPERIHNSILSGNNFSLTAAVAGIWFEAATKSVFQTWDVNIVLYFRQTTV